MTTPLTAADLAQITSAVETAQGVTEVYSRPEIANTDPWLWLYIRDAPRLLAEVERLRARMAELEG